LEHLANAPHGRYILSGTAVFAYRADEWRARITGGQSMSYLITRRPGRGGRYLTAAWACPATTSDLMCAQDPNDEARADGPVVGVDLNDGHLAVRRLDEHGNPVGRPERIALDLTGSSARRDAQVRHAITQLLHYTRHHGVGTVAVEDLDFADARTVGRETMGRGAHGKRFRKSVAGISTAVFRNRLTAQAHRHDIRLYAVNPAYSSVWGAQHWRTPYENVTRHEAAATVIGRRAQGLTARRREGVTRTRPEDRVVRATDQATPENQQASTRNRHRPRDAGIQIPPAPAGQERGTWAGQPLPRHRPTTANMNSNGVVDLAVLGAQVDRQHLFLLRRQFRRDGCLGPPQHQGLDPVAQYRQSLPVASRFDRLTKVVRECLGRRELPEIWVSEVEIRIGIAIARHGPRATRCWYASRSRRPTARWTPARCVAPAGQPTGSRRTRSAGWPWRRRAPRAY
jgi:hypothetical protein